MISYNKILKHFLEISFENFTNLNENRFRMDTKKRILLRESFEKQRDESPKVSELKIL
jgi:hypothetical protein